MTQQVRRIREELYRDLGYDAIWRLPNAGFVLRLGGTYVFLDPILSSPHPHYLATRNKITATGELPYFHEELKHYELEDVSQEVGKPPLTPDEVEAADHVLITHGHEDHLDDAAIRALSALGPKVLAPRSCHARLLSAGIPSDSLTEAVHGDAHKFEGFSMDVIPASHTNSQAAEIYADACGYLLKTAHGNFFLPGDGVFDHDGKSLIASLDVTYLLVPINDTNLGVGFAALLTHILQPRVVVPCHYGYVAPPVRSQAGHPAEFVTALAARNYSIPTTDIVILQPGGRLVLA